MHRPTRLLATIASKNESVANPTMDIRGSLTVLGQKTKLGVARPPLRDKMPQRTDGRVRRCNVTNTLCEIMETLLAFIIVVVLAGAVIVQLIFAWQYFRSSNEAGTGDPFEKDVEWQLQHELDDAVMISSKPAPVALTMRSLPLLASKSSSTPHSHFSYSQAPLGSYVELTSYYGSMTQGCRPKAKSRTLSVSQEPPMSLNSAFNVLSPFERNRLVSESPILVNPKQFERIQKRRLARKWIENYFEKRREPSEQRRTRLALH